MRSQMFFRKWQKKRAEEFGIANVYTVEGLLADQDIEIVVNLTSPKAHTEVNLRVLRRRVSMFTRKNLLLCPLMMQIGCYPWQNKKDCL